MKICSKCKVEKTYDDFGKKARHPDGHSYTCKECANKKRREQWKEKEVTPEEKEKRKEYYDRYYDKNKTKLSEYGKKYYSENKEKVLDRTAKYREENRDEINKKLRVYHRREDVKERNRLRYKNDINYKLKKVLRSRVIDALKKKGNYKTESTEDLIGCSIPELLRHIERQFQEGMSWDNHGFGDDKWHVDHIIPCDSFNLEQEEERRKCFNYKNLQPLWQKENISKGNKMSQEVSQVENLS